MTVGEVEARMTPWELREWLAFEAEFGPLTPHERIDVAAGVIAYAVARSAGAERVELTDFIPRWERPAEPPSAFEFFQALARKA